MSNWGNFLLGNSYSEDIIKQTKFYSKRERERELTTFFSSLAPTERDNTEGHPATYSIRLL